MLTVGAVLLSRLRFFVVSEINLRVAIFTRMLQRML